MGKVVRLLKLGVVVFSILFATLQLNGCATATAGLECAAEAMNPTIMAALDSFESAAISIKLSNRILLEMPISETDKWPDELYGTISGAGALKMGLSLFGSSQGITIPTQIDPETGFPRPTSALYIFLKERETMLNKRANKDDIRFFSAQPPRVIARQIPEQRRKADLKLIDDNIYRSPLMAYGVVTANRGEMVRLQQEIDLISMGFKQCDAWIHKSKDGDVKPAACKDPALKQDDMENRMRKVSTSPPLPADTKPEPLPAPENEKPQSTEELPKPAVTLDKALDKPVVTQQAAADVPEPKTRQDKSKAKKDSKKKNSKKSVATVTPPPPPEVREPVVAKMETPPPPPPAVDKPVNGNEKIIVVSERDRQMGEKGEELETMKKNYGKLADRVYKASVAGADFTMAAMTKLVCAIVNGVRALPNAQNEIKGWRGAYNVAMLLPRIKGVVKSFGYYKDNLGLQLTAYKTMYQQIKGTYPELTDEPAPTDTPQSKEALLRIESASALLASLEPKLQMLAEGREVVFTDDEALRVNVVARTFPSHDSSVKEIMLALGMTP